MKRLITTCLTALASASLFASQIAPGAHTWHNITADNGTWKATLSMISEPDHAYFVAADDVTKISTLTIHPNAPQKFGFVFTPGATFDIAYTVTITEQKEISASQFTSKACVFVVTAKSPATPDITTTPYNGAKCSWTDTGIGEDFNVA